MIGIMLLAVNERERQILTMAFEQYHAKVIQTQPSYSNYIKAMQYEPDVIIMEIPKINMDQCHFASLIRKSKKSRRVPIIGYGESVEMAVKRFLTKNGISEYIQRPLKFTPLLKILEKYLKLSNKSILAATQNKKSEKESDIKHILDPKTLPSKKVELMTKHISNLMAFPFTVAKVLRLTESKSSGANDLAKVIEADPVIAASILKMSNAVFYASRNRRINSIKEAIVRIGLNETKRIVMTVSVMDLFGSQESNFGFNRMSFWLHSLSTAIISSHIAQNISGLNSDEVFLSGLLHDFGIILLDEFFPTIFSNVLEQTTNNCSRFVENEKDILSITHNDLVKELFSIWNIPDNISNAICKHYSIHSDEKKIETPADTIALCITLGNILSKSLCHGKSCDQYIVPLNKWIFDRVKMANGINDAYVEKIIAELILYQKFLNIDVEEKGGPADSCIIAVYTPDQCVFSPVETYFKAQGYEVIKIPQSDSYASFDNQFDLICAWNSDELSAIKVDSLKGIVQRCNTVLDPTQEPILTPLLVLAKNSTALSTEIIGNSVTFLSNEIDLRQLDEKLMTTGEKKTDN